MLVNFINNKLINSFPETFIKSNNFLTLIFYIFIPDPTLIIPFALASNILVNRYINKNF